MAVVKDWHLFRTKERRDRCPLFTLLRHCLMKSTTLWQLSFRATLVWLALDARGMLATTTVIDLSHELGDDTIYWPGFPPFNFTIHTRGPVPPIEWYESNSYATAEHGGTHVDAPAHFAEGKWRAHQVPASHLVGPAAVVDVRSKANANADYCMTVDDLLAWEGVYGRIPDKAIVVMDSGWGSRYPDPFLAFNSKNPKDPRTFHFPGVHPTAAKWLVFERNIVALGVDTPSLDYGQSRTFETHVILSQNNVLGIENLANVNQLPARGATIVMGLIKLRNGSGAPARILGLVDDECVCPTSITPRPDL